MLSDPEELPPFTVKEAPEVDKRNAGQSGLRVIVAEPIVASANPIDTTAFVELPPVLPPINELIVVAKPVKLAPPALSFSQVFRFVT